MKYALSVTLFVLSFTLYPVLLRVPVELQFLWNGFEWDLFNWYRLILIMLVGIPSLLLLKRKDYVLFLYLFFLSVSTIFSRSIETSLFGTPNFHEGFFALISYVGIFLLARKYKEKDSFHVATSLAVYVCFFVSLLQLIYGNFLEFPLFKWVMPKLDYQHTPWPLFSTMGSPNHLGLFCATLLPYFLIKKSRYVCFALVFLLIGSQTRGAWASALITTLIISRRYLLYVGLAFLLFCVPFHKRMKERFYQTVSTFHYPLRDSDLDGRVYMWSRTLPIAKNTILFGNGPASHPLYFPQFCKRSLAVGYGNAIVDRPHNIYLNIWENTGLVSLVILAAGIFLRIKKEKDRALKMSAIGFLIAGFFTDSVLCVTPYFVTILGLMGEE